MGAVATGEYQYMATLRQKKAKIARNFTDVAFLDGKNTS
jgi:hypothetical protein